MMGSVFAMQGIGQFAAGIISLISIAGFKDSLSSSTTTSACATNAQCIESVDKIWRIIIGFGAVPAVIALYFRLTIPETPRYTFDVARDVEKAGEDVKAYIQGKAEGRPDEVKRLQTLQESQTALTMAKPSFRDFVRHNMIWRNGRVLLGTAGSWFLLDVAFYGLGLNNTIIIAAVGYGGGANVYQILYNLSVGNIILVVAGAIPGYWVTVALVDTIGRKPIQFGGFAILTVIFCVIGFAYNVLSNSGLLALFVLAQFFFNFGPNATTFIIPGEVFPTRYRSTSHGLSAASGKVGAIIAQVVFGPLRVQGAAPGAKGKAASPWLNHVIEIFALFMLCGVFTTLLLPETKRRTLEELSGEEPAANVALGGLHPTQEGKEMTDGSGSDRAV